MTEEPGAVTDISVPNYVVGETLGAGGFGTVVRAKHAVIGREVAIKVLHHRYSGDAEVVARFVAEARAVNQISHPSIVEIFDFGTLADGRHYCEMDLLTGRTLRVLLADRGRLPLVEALPILRGIAAAVGAAHRVGIAHRDLKPENVFLTANGRIKLIDFGLAKLSDREGAPVTQTGAVFGTPLYMSPEQCRGRDIDTHTDLYAFGALAYHVLVGEPPFSGDALELALHHLNDTPIAPSTRCPDLPPRVDEALLTLLAKQPAQRASLASAISTLAGEAHEVPLSTADTMISDAPAARATALSAHATNHHRRRTLVIGAAAIGVTAAAVLAVRLWPSAWLPATDRRLAIDAVNRGVAEDAWLAPAIGKLATRQLRQRELRFLIVDDPGLANVVAHVGYRRDATGVTLQIDLDANDQARSLGSFHGTSVAAALGQALPEVAATVGTGQPVRGPDEGERTAMAQLGAPTFDDYRRYTSIVDEQWGTNDTDSEAVARKIAELADRAPRWAHARALQLLVGGGPTARTRVPSLRAAIADRPHDPAGVTIFDAIEAQTPEEVARLVPKLEAAVEQSPADVILAALLSSTYFNLGRTDDAIGVLRRIHDRRPDLQFGGDLAGTLREAGRSGEIDALLHAWLVRTPDSEQALISTVKNDIDHERLDDAVRMARAIVFLHGDDAPRMRTLCDVLIAADRVSEAGPLADRMLRGSPFERVNGRIRLGTIAIMEGRFSAAWETLRTLENPGTAMYGADANLLEIARDLAENLELVDDAHRLAGKLETVYSAQANAVPALALQFQRELAHGCTSIETAVATLPDGAARATARRALLRAAVAAGCASCAEVVRAGRAPTEHDDRSLYQFGVCAEAENALELAADVFRELRVVRLVDRSPASGFAYRAMLARYHLARVLERQGKRAEAKAGYQEFLAHWGHADRPVAEVDAARAALTRL